MNTDETITVWLCEDCVLAANGYDAHEIGYEPDSEPLAKLDGYLVLRDYCPDHYWRNSDTPCENCDGEYNADEDDGREDFSTRDCSGCNTRLAGGRYRHVLHAIPEGMKRDA